MKGPSQEGLQFRDPNKVICIIGKGTNDTNDLVFQLYIEKLGLKTKVKNQKKDINLLISTIFNSLCLYSCNHHWCFVVVVFHIKEITKIKKIIIKLVVLCPENRQLCFYDYTPSL